MQGSFDYEDQYLSLVLILTEDEFFLEFMDHTIPPQLFETFMNSGGGVACQVITSFCGGVQC
jgi:hypothetical protein